MILTKITLKNFRNYKNVAINLNNNINIFIGDNAQGKTNILESIYILAITKSHRFGIENNLIRMGEDSTKIQGTLKIDKIIKKLEFNLDKSKKIVKINNNEVKKISNYISNLNVIMFCPDDLDVIKGSPSIRRNLINIEISQIHRNYVDILNEYNKILKIRNEYLKLLYLNSLSDKRYLDILTEKLINLAVQIYKYRFDFISSINNNISNIYKNLGNTSNLYIKYLNNIDVDLFDEENIKNKLNSKFKSNYKRELIQGVTLYGPHRDDLLFCLDEEDIKCFGSQGQQRLAIISFKLAEIEIFKEKTNTNPILLLDDIFSEIDLTKKNKLLKYISDDVQTIITTTDLKNISKKNIINSKIFVVKEGNIIEKVEK